MREGILVSPRMMADHMPDYLTLTLQGMATKAATPGQMTRVNGQDVFVVEVPPSPDSMSTENHRQGNGQHVQAHQQQQQRMGQSLQKRNSSPSMADIV